MARSLLLCLGSFYLIQTSSVSGQNCPADPGTALYEVARECINGRTPGEVPLAASSDNVFSVQYWNQTCAGRPEVAACLANVFVGCGTKYIQLMTQEAQNIILNFHLPYWRYGFDHVDYCDGNQIKSSIRNMFMDGDSVSCLDEPAKTKVTGCINSFYTEVNNYMRGLYNATLSSDDAAVVTRWAKATYQCVLDIARTDATAGHTCGRPAQDILVFIVNQTIPSQIRSGLSEADIYVDLDQHQILSFERSTVGVFGDPHLRIYDRDYLITCSAVGEQNYLTGPLMKITGVNTFVRTSRATSLTKVNIEFRHSDTNGAITTIGNYIAESSQLPETFSGTSQTQLQDPSGNTLKLTKVGNSIKITHNKYAYVLFIRQWNANYFFTLRMGDRVFNASTGMLISGCPTADRLDSTNVPSRRRRAVTSEQAVQACQNVMADGGRDYNAKCLFDVTTAEDTTIAAMSSGFKEEISKAVQTDPEFPLADPPAPDTSSAARFVMTTWICLYATLIPFI